MRLAALLLLACHVESRECDVVPWCGAVQRCCTWREECWLEADGRDPVFCLGSDCRAAVMDVCGGLAE